MDQLPHLAAYLDELLSARQTVTHATASARFPRQQPDCVRNPDDMSETFRHCQLLI